MRHTDLSQGGDSASTAHFPPRSSEVMNSRPSATIQQNSDNYNRDRPPFRYSEFDLNLARDAYNAVAPYPRVPVGDLLNLPPGSTSQDNRYSGVGASNENDHDPRRAIQTVLGSRTPSIISISSTDSLTSSQIADDCLSLMHVLYETCRGSSASYLHDIRVEFPVRSRRNGYHLYDRNLRPGHQAPRRDEERPKSLMENISAICSHFWRTARCHPSNPRRREARVIQSMQDFYTWGELVSRCERNGIDNVSEDGELFAGSVSSSIGIVSLDDIGEAAIALCDVLDDKDAMWTCKELVERLRELEDMGARFEWL